MPRKAHLAPHLEPEELKKKYRQSKDVKESRRWHLLWKIAEGGSIKESAAALDFSYGYAQRVVKKYNDLGEAGVKTQARKRGKGAGGRKALLSDKQLEKLAQAIESKPNDGGIWTGPKVARWMEQETGIEKVWNQRGWDYLKKCGYSWQRPRPTHKKADKTAQTKFKQNLPLEVKTLQTEYPDCKIEVWFFDEHRVGLKPILKKVWSRVGERPEAIVQHQYEWVYVYGFVEPKTGKTLWYLIPRVNTKWMNLVLNTFAIEAQANQKKIILLIQDRAGWHRSSKVNLPAGVVTEFLPAYSPELQPAERLWSLVDEPLVNQHFNTIDEIEDILAQRCCVLSKMQDEIRNLTNYHWLKYP